MLRALFTGISGLTAHQQMLDVTANNIANVNTTGFKASRTAFQDTLSQTMQGASGPRTNAAGNPSVGGTNALQIGLGVKLSGTEMNMGQGSNQTTGVGTDLMINGDGFFVVQKGDGQQVLYTRAGGFHMDSEGHLVAADGAIVSGVAPDAGGAFTHPTSDDPNDPNGPRALDLSALLNGYNKTTNEPITNDDTPPADPTQIGTYVSYTIDSSGSVKAVRDSGGVDILGQITMATFANPNGMEKAGDSEFARSDGSGQPVFGAADDGAHGSISAGYLEMSNVDLAGQLTNLIISERGFQANSKSVTTADQILQTLVNLKQ